MELSRAITEASSIEQIVIIVNKADEEAITYFGGTETRDGSELAGHYAVHCSIEPHDMNEIEAHLDFLKNAGAEFDYLIARNTAKTLAESIEKMNNTKEMFYRINENGDAAVFHQSGDVVTVIDANVYPVGSNFSARYEHPQGIVLSVSDAEKIGIAAE